MPPLYTSKPLANRTIQSPAYSQRGLKENVAALEDVAIVGHPEIVQPHYPSYIANLSAFIMATSIQRKVTCGTTYLPSVDLNLILPLRLPTITIAPLTPFPNSATEDEYLAKIPKRFTPITFIKRKVYAVSDIEASDLPKLPPSDPRVPSTSDSVNIRTMRQLGVTLKIVTLFLATHTYPAFQTQNDVDDTHGDFASDMDLHMTETNEVEPGFRGRKRHYRSASGQRKWDEGVHNVDPIVPIANYPGEESSSMMGAVFVAKPAPLYPKVNYGPPSEIPNYPGYVLPYFRGINFPSRVQIIAVMRRFFYGCFGSTIAHRQTNWKEWENCLDSWYKTDTGIEIAHLLTCVQSALEAQARVFVILNGRKYLGCAILGYRFHISKFGVLVAPETPEELRNVASQLDEHSRAVSQIAETLAGVSLKGAEDLEMNVEVNVTSARMIHRELEIRRSLTEEEQGTIQAALKDIAFEQRYWTMGGETITKAIRAIISDDPIPPDWPMYLSPNCFEDQSRIFKVLSVFGPTAPSFMDAAGTEVKIPEGIDAPDPMSLIPTGETQIRMPKLFVSGKLLHLATAEMRGVFGKRRIRQNFKERAGGYRTIAISGKLRDDLWEALRMIPLKTSKVAGKRARDDEDEEGGVRKKVDKKVSSIEEEVLTGF